jgi:hypothetical protein
MAKIERYEKHAIDVPDPVREGHGEGCFVVVRADK